MMERGGRLASPPGSPPSAGLSVCLGWPGMGLTGVGILPGHTPRASL